LRYGLGARLRSAVAGCVLHCFCKFFLADRRRADLGQLFKARRCLHLGS